jgi:hypothetical protein
MRFEYRLESDSGQNPIEGGDNSLIYKFAQAHRLQMLRCMTGC